MATITDYTSLQQNIRDIVEDDGTELLMYLPTAIDLAEERLFRELDLPELEDVALGALTGGSSILVKPADYSFNHHLIIFEGTVRKILKKRTKNFLIDYWPDTSQQDRPKYYADINENTIAVAPTPNTTYSYELAYSKKPTKLSDANTTNYFIENTKDILLFAALKEVTKFMKSWTQADTFEKEFVNARDTWNIEMKRKRRDDGETPNNPSGGPNSLAHTIRSNS